MTKPVIVTRLGKGSELSFQEGDDNFTNLRDATISVGGDSGTTQNIDLNGTITVAGGTGLSTAMTSGTVTVNLDNTAVTSGSYTNANITVNAQGQITSAANGFSGSYTDLTNQPTIPTNNNQLTNGAGYITGINSSAVTTALGFTPEDSADKGQANGYASLDSSGLVPSSQLPSFVDDVLEYASQASFPVTGESNKIYVAIDTGKTYRWSGSAYVEISASPGTTDSLTEGSTNLYFTTQRARDAFSASTGISITNGAISTSITQYTDSSARSAISVTDNGGDGSLSYDNGTGVISYTGPGSSDYRAAFSAGTGISITNGVIASTVSAGASAINDLSDVNVMVPLSDGQLLRYNSTSTNWENWSLTGVLTDVVNDTSPSLGGNLDVNGNAIVSTSNGNIQIAPNGTGNIQLVPSSGKITLGAVDWPTSNPSNNTFLVAQSNGTSAWSSSIIGYNEGSLYDLGTTGGTITPNAANGNVQKITLNSALTINGFTSAIAGQSITLIIYGGTSYTSITSTMKFAGGVKTLTGTSGCIDILSIYYDGTNYFASLAKGFA